MSLEFGSERACAPPALSALNLGRLLRVVLPVRRDCSADNPNTPCDSSSCVLIASGLALAQCTKVYPGAAGLARLHYGGCSKVRVRLKQPHLSAPKRSMYKRPMKREVNTKELAPPGPGR